MNFITPFRYTSSLFFVTNQCRSNTKKRLFTLVSKLEKRSFYESFSQEKTLKKKITMVGKQKINSSEENSKWLSSILFPKKMKKTLFLNNFRKIGKIVLKNTQMPTRKDESWRFTSLNKLFQMRFFKHATVEDDSFIPDFFIQKSFARIVFVNGVFSSKFSSLKNIPNKLFMGEFSDLTEEKKKKISKLIGKGESGINGGFFSILNMACLEEITVLSFAPNFEIEKPIQIIFASSVQEGQICLNQRVIVFCEKFSKARVIEQHISSDNAEIFDNSATNIVLEEGSEINYILANQISQKGSLISSIHADLQKNSYFNFLSASSGGFLSRINLGIDLNGTRSRCDVQGLTIIKDEQLSDIHSRISHNYPNCNSLQFHKNLVTEKAKAVFAGKIQVHNGASETESEQLCKTLLLSPTSKVDSMPVLEINNENVKCAHGSTISDLDDDQIFYFQSRGISTEKARFLLTLGFVREIIAKFPKELISYFTKSIDSFV